MVGNSEFHGDRHLYADGEFLESVLGYCHHECVGAWGDDGVQQNGIAGLERQPPGPAVLRQRFVPQKLQHMERVGVQFEPVDWFDDGRDEDRFGELC